MKIKIKFLCALTVLLIVLVAACADASDVNSELKREFMSLYDSEWKLYNFNYRLFTIIDSDFDSQMKSMPFGTGSFQLALNYDNIAEKILSSMFQKFYSEYILFLRRFQSDFYKRLQNNSQVSFIKQTEQSLAFSNVVELYRQGEQKMLDSVWSNLHARIEDRLSTPHISFMWLLLGIFIILFRGLLARIFSSDKKTKNVRKIFGLAGLLCFILGVVFVSRGLFFTKGVAREFFNEQAKVFYTSELPDMFWNIIKEHITTRTDINS